MTLKLTVIGNLTRDAVMRHTQGGDSVLNFSVARNDRRTQETTYVDCTIWGKLAQSLEPYLKKGQKVKLMSTGAVHPVERVGIFRPKQEMRGVLGPGEIGFLTASIKSVADCKVGDTLTEEKRQTAEPLPGFREVKPMVFAGLYPTDARDYEELRTSLARFKERWTPRVLATPKRRQTAMATKTTPMTRRLGP